MRTRGMTLIELMVVLVLVGLLAAVSVSAFTQGVQARKEIIAVREIYTQAIKAKTVARGTGNPVRMTVRAVNGVNMVRWERLPCTDAWNTTCPTATCQTQLCGAGCVCPEVGQDIELPASVNAASLHGLCFIGGSGLPRSGLSCQPGNPTPARNSFSIQTKQADPYFLVVEPLTGQPKVVDCGSSTGKHDEPALCP